MLWAGLSLTAFRAKARSTQSLPISGLEPATANLQSMKTNI